MPDRPPSPSSRPSSTTCRYSAAQELGSFGEAGLGDGRLPTGAERDQRVVDGSADIGIGTPEGASATPRNAGHGRRQRRELANALITRREITSVEGLRGATIGVSHAREGTALLAREMLAAHGLQPGDYEIKAMGVASAVVRRSRAGRPRRGPADRPAQVPRRGRRLPQPRRHQRLRARLPVHVVQRAPRLAADPRRPAAPVPRRRGQGDPVAVLSTSRRTPYASRRS